VTSHSNRGTKSSQPVSALLGSRWRPVNRDRRSESSFFLGVLACSSSTGGRRLLISFPRSPISFCLTASSLAPEQAARPEAAVRSLASRMVAGRPLADWTVAATLLAEKSPDLAKPAPDPRAAARPAANHALVAARLALSEPASARASKPFAARSRLPRRPCPCARPWQTRKP